MKKITKKQINYFIESFKELNYLTSLNESIMLEYHQTILLLLLEIRDSLQHKHCKCSNLKTDPSKLKKNDILIGESE